MRNRILPALLALVLLLSMTPAAFAANANSYKDVGTEEWFYPAVEYMSGKGYMVGTSDTEFAPGNTLSRAMFVTILYRISGEKVQTAGTRFTDVPQNTWYTEAVSWAVANGITSGTGDALFSPNDPVTREQMATFIDRYVRSKNIDLGDEYIVGEPDDLFDGNVWGRNPIIYAYEYALLFTTNGKAYPMNNATRADAVVAFYNLLCQHALVLPDTKPCSHNWITRHVEEVGHHESSGTHMVYFSRCHCGFTVTSDDPNATEVWEEHYFNHGGRSIFGTKEVPNDPQYVVDTPAHDESYCTICGAVR